MTYLRYLPQTRNRLPFLLIATLIGAHNAFAVPAENGASFTQIESFELLSHRGGSWKLEDYADRELVVVAFLGTECPLAKLYAGRLAELHRRYADKNVGFIGINANTQDSMTELTAYANRYGIPFPLLKDVGNRVADQFSAERTPEVFVLDKNRAIRYRGRIDDQYGVGYARDKVDRQDLAVAIDELLAGKQVSVPETLAVGCVIGRVKKVEPRGDVTYTNQIARIFNARCVECHRDSEIAPFTLTAYEDVIGWEDTILEVIADNRMPPWFADPAHGEFKNDARLTSEEKQLIRTWVANGMPEGDPADLPEPPQYVPGWRIPEPDQVVYMQDEAFSVPAEGVVDYKYFKVDPGWEEDKYIYAAEARPDNREVVHHIIVYVLPPGTKPGSFENRTMLVGYAPGADPCRLEDSIAMYVPAGSQLVFEMHYTPNGSPHLDRSYVGFAFTQETAVKKLLKGRLAINQRFEIPPGAARHLVTADYRVRKDELLKSMTPHMHLRGTAFRYEAEFPDGRREILLDVPKYDFNWQLSYELAEPRLLPRGTRIVCTAAFDNSADNPVNPDPTKAVRWGDQSWEEMMIGFFNVLPPDTAAKSPAVIDPSCDPTGVWEWKRGNQTEQLALQLAEGKLSGTVTSGGNELAIQAARLENDRLTFELAVPEYGDQVTLEFDIRVSEESLVGDVAFVAQAVGKARNFPFKAERVQPPPTEK